MSTSRLDSLAERARADFALLAGTDIPVVFLGAGSCGRAAGADEVKKAVQATLAQRELDARVVEVGCVGPCYLEPLLDVAAFGNPRVSYANVGADEVAGILESYLVRRDPRPGRAVGHFGDGDFAGIPRFFDLPMLKAQTRVVLRNCGFIDPGEPRPLPRAGRLPGTEEGARHVARRGDRRDHPVGDPRPGRRRLPDREEMALRPRRPGRSEIHDLQRRRGRPRRLHEPLADRGRPARGARGPADRGLRHRRLVGLRVHPRRIPARDPAAA